MTVPPPWAIFAAAAVLPVAMFLLTEWDLRTRARRTARYLDRPCAGIYWHRRFPGVPHGEIRAFLRTFADCFDLNRDCPTRFRPADRVLDIQQAVDGGFALGLGDAIELTAWGNKLCERHPHLRSAEWADAPTLGDVLDLTRAARRSGG